MQTCPFSIVDELQNQSAKRRIFAAKQGSADAVARQKDKFHALVLWFIDYNLNKQPPCGKVQI